MMGWAVNSIAEAVEGSIPFLPKIQIIYHNPYVYIKYIIKVLIIKY